MKTCLRLCTVIVVLAASVAAQQAPPVEKLPPDTWVYFRWDGLAAADKVRTSNPLLRLWDDPEFAAVREELAQKFFEEMQEKNETKRQEGKPVREMTREDAEMLLSVLSNPLVAGVAGKDEPGEKMGEETAYFVILDHTGKEDLIRKLDERFPDAPETEVTSFNFRGVEVKRTVKLRPTPAAEENPAEPPEEEPQEGAEPAEEPAPKKEIAYRAQFGRYDVTTGSRAVMEGLIERLGDGGPAAETLATNANYLATRKYRTADSMAEFFLQVPDLSKMESKPTAQGLDYGAMVKGLHLERVKAIVGTFDLTASSGVMRGATLGDTSAGSVFDVVGASEAVFQTLAAAPQGASFTSFRLDLHALYTLVKNAVVAGLPPEQAAGADMMEGLVTMQTGMTLPEVLALIPGEFAMVQTRDMSPTDLTGGLYAMAVRNRDGLLGLLRTVLADRIATEDQAGDATLLALAQPYRDPDTGAQRKRFYHVGVGTNLLVAGKKKSDVQEALARAQAGAAAPAAGSLAADPAFQATRKRLPAKLTGLTYSDLTRIPWEKYREEFLKEMEKQGQQREEARKKAEEEARAAAAEAAAEAGVEPPAPQPPDPQEEARRAAREEAQRQFMEKLITALSKVVPRYLHVTAGGWWKAADGVFLESFIE